jgi:hypothetical protein
MNRLQSAWGTSPWEEENLRLPPDRSKEGVESGFPLKRVIDWLVREVHDFWYSFFPGLFDSAEYRRHFPETRVDLRDIERVGDGEAEERVANHAVSTRWHGLGCAEAELTVRSLFLARAHSPDPGAERDRAHRGTPSRLERRSISSFRLRSFREYYGPISQGLSDFPETVTSTEPTIQVSFGVGRRPSFPWRNESRRSEPGYRRAALNDRRS